MGIGRERLFSIGSSMSGRSLAFLIFLSWSADLARPDRNVGCLFNADVCEFDEYCFDDNAFGLCQNERDSEADFYRHSLSSDTMRLLEKELSRLFAGGYRWDHDYTQCVVQNILYAKRHKVSYDPGLCSRIMQLTLPDIPPQVLPDLESVEPDDLAMIKFEPDRETDENFVYAAESFVPPLEDGRNSKKVDTPSSDEEILKKKRSPGQVLLPEKEEEERKWDPDALLRRLFEVANDAEKLFDVEDDFASRLPSSELSVTKTDLSSDMDNRPIFSEGGMDWIPVSDDGPNVKEGANEEILGPGEREMKRRAKAEEVTFPLFIPNTYKNGPERGFDSGTKGKPHSSRFSREEEQDLPFQWNWNHFHQMDDDDDIDEYHYTPQMKNRIKNLRTPRRNEDRDYLQNKYRDFFAMDDDILPTFQRPMRYDTKKPGPTFYLHDDEDGVSYEDDSEDIPHGGDVLQRLMEQHQMKQMNDLLGSRSKIMHKTSPGYTEIQEDERLKELIHIRYSPQPLDPKSDKAAENKTDSNDGDNNVKRTYQDAPIPRADATKGPFPYWVTKPQSLEQVEDGDKSGEGHRGHYAYVDSTQTHLNLKNPGASSEDGEKLVKTLEKLLDLSRGTFSNIRVEGKKVTFKVNPNTEGLNASDVAAKAEDLVSNLKAATGLTVESAGIGDKVEFEVSNNDRERTLFILTFILCGSVVGVSLVVAVVYVIRRHARSKEKLQNISQPDTEASQDYQDLCRQRMASKTNEGPETNVHAGFSPKKMRSLSQGEGQVSSSSHSSTSSWNEEPVTSNMDISTGHMILAYMEDHLKKKDRLDREWEAMCAYEAEPCSTVAALLPQNVKKNRYPDVLPYDHSRVVLNELSNVSGSDYINANSITDHDPRNPAYIATQGPLPHTAADFWQMVWEQGSVVMVMLTRLMENGVAMCHRHWPEEGSEVYHIYEVHLVSEHMWCDIFLVRSFYLKNLRTGETRTVTQFHFLSWPDNGVPNSTKALLEFRRKVNKSYRGRSCPIVVHCSDGIGRTGTYILIDMVLNRMAKGAKEIDIAATLEHIRDQRAGMVKTKAQFEFVLMAIAEEVHAILKALSQ